MGTVLKRSSNANILHTNGIDFNNLLFDLATNETQSDISQLKPSFLVLIFYVRDSSLNKEVNSFAPPLILKFFGRKHVWYIGRIWVELAVVSAVGSDEWWHFPGRTGAANSRNCGRRYQLFRNPVTASAHSCLNSSSVRYFPILVLPLQRSEEEERTNNKGNAYILRD